MSRYHEEQAMYVWRNTGACLRNHFYSGKATYCVFVVSVIQYAKRMRRNAQYYIVIYSLSGYAIFSHFIPQTARYS